jgi:hypothetical protein
MRRSEMVETVRLFPLRLGPWLRFVANRNAYSYLDEASLRGRRRSDTVFVFGSGASLNELSAEDWEEIARHDTFGFNWFVHEQFVRCDFHLIRGIPDTDLDPRVWRPQLEEYFGLIRTNPCFADTVLLVHGGFRAINGNRAIGYRLLPTDRPLFRWRTNVRDELPSRSFGDGLVHGHSTLQECINAAYLLGWKQIVLAGVDLYDRRYFWLAPDATRSVDIRRRAVASDAHARATSGLVEMLGQWRRWLENEDVRLTVLNPRSLLAAVLPVFARCFSWRSG